MKLFIQKAGTESPQQLKTIRARKKKKYFLLYFVFFNSLGPGKKP